MKLVDKTIVDVWLSIDGEYSYHWEQRNIRDIIYRHDNAPHAKWGKIKTFPKHCHDGSQKNVVESYISKYPQKGIVDFLTIVKSQLFKT